MVIGIYGLGAIGSNLLVQLAKQFPENEYHGIDFDKVEDRNVRTQAYFLEHVGMPKADAMRVILARYLRKPNYKPFRMKIERPEMIGNHDLTIDCFDNTASRELFKDRRGNILHIGFSPTYFAECHWNEGYEAPGDVDASKGDFCTMTEAVGFIHLAVNAAVANISRFLETKEKKNCLIQKQKQGTIIKWL